MKCTAHKKRELLAKNPLVLAASRSCARSLRGSLLALQCVMLSLVRARLTLTAVTRRAYGWRKLTRGELMPDLAIRTEDTGKLPSFYMDVFDMQVLHNDKDSK